MILATCLGMVGLSSAQWIYSLRRALNEFTCLATNGSIVFAGSHEGGGVYRSIDNGVTWTGASSGLTNDRINALFVSGTKLFAGTRGAGVFLSADSGKSWKAVNSGMSDADVRSFAVSGANLFVGTFGKGVFRSTNDGAGWAQKNSGLTDLYVLSLAFKGTNLFAGTDSTGVFLSTDHGEGWAVTGPGLPKLHSMGITFTAEVYSLAVSGSAVFAGTDGALCRSTDNGWSWQKANDGLPYSNPTIPAVLATDKGIFASVNIEGIYRSTDKGITWTNFSTGGFTGLSHWLSPYALASSGSYLFTAAGTVWRRSLLTAASSEEWEFVMDADTANHGLVTFEKYSDGSIGAIGSWSYMNQGSLIQGIFSSISAEFTNTSITINARGLAEYAGYRSIFDQTMTGNLQNGTSSSGTFEMGYFADGWPVGTQGTYVATKISGNGVTSVDETAADAAPRAFGLSQNYPNPFNPSTKIRYQLSETSPVSMKVFDMTGSEIATLVNERKPAGSYQVVWNAAGLPSGVYFCRLQTGWSVETKKLMLLK